MPTPADPPPHRYGPSLRVRLNAEQSSALELFARSDDLSLSAALRLAVSRGLRALGTSGAPEQDAAEAALAALCAAEHNRLLLELILPAGRARATELAEQAALNAEARLRSAARVERLQW